MDIVRFEAGACYYCASAWDSDCVWRFTVQRRTLKFVVLVGQFPDGSITKRVRVSTEEDAMRGTMEYCKPLGGYSCATVLRATNKSV